MEIWKPIKGYEGKYLVSNEGRLLSCTTGQFLTPKKDSCGYLIVRLKNKCGKKYQLVHRLVAHAFILKPIGLNEINHINEIKDDNRVENLEWVSHKDNLIKHYEKHPDIYKHFKIENYGKKLNYSQPDPTKPRTRMDYRGLEVAQITLDDKLIKVWKNISTIVKEKGFNNTSICECCKNKRRTAYGYKWQFAIDIQ